MTNIIYPKSLLLEFTDEEKRKNGIIINRYMEAKKERPEIYHFGYRLINLKRVCLNEIIVYQYDKHATVPLLSNDPIIYKLELILIYPQSNLKINPKKNLKRSSLYAFDEFFSGDKDYYFTTENPYPNCFMVYTMNFKNEKDREKILKDFEYLYDINKRLENIIEHYYKL